MQKLQKSGPAAASHRTPVMSSPCKSRSCSRPGSTAFPDRDRVAGRRGTAPRRPRHRLYHAELPRPPARQREPPVPLQQLDELQNGTGRLTSVGGLVGAPSAAAVGGPLCSPGGTRRPLERRPRARRKSFANSNAGKLGRPFQRHYQKVRKFTHFAVNLCCLPPISAYLWTALEKGPPRQ